MIEIKVCPSTLAEGFNSYSPAARKVLFDGKMVLPYLLKPSPVTDSMEAKEAIEHIGRISLSGVQPKFAVVIGEDLHLQDLTTKHENLVEDACYRKKEKFL